MIIMPAGPPSVTGRGTSAASPLSQFGRQLTVTAGLETEVDAFLAALGRILVETPPVPSR